jgi:hypothetical protein
MVIVFHLMGLTGSDGGSRDCYKWRKKKRPTVAANVMLLTVFGTEIPLSSAGNASADSSLQVMPILVQWIILVGSEGLAHGSATRRWHHDKSTAFTVQRPLGHK